MKRIVLFDTSYGTQNLGDYIINQAIGEEMKFLLRDNFVVHYGTHNPLLRFSQNLKKNPISSFCKEADLKFLCGTNLFSKNLDRLTPNFNINYYDAKNYRESIAVGCGLADVNKGNSIRTKLIYKKILSKSYKHSVRDNNAKKYLESLGLEAINTGCPTLWKLTPDFCKSIPAEKAIRVVFTLTDYDKNEEKDERLISILKKNYKEVYFWVQGTGDYDYFNNLRGTSGIKVIPPSLESYEELLKEGKIDYVGTRLHAGIYAMRHGVRSIILAIDNRVRDMRETYNLVTVERDDIDRLNELINDSFKTNIKINEKAIAEWKGQFNENR